MGWGTLKTSAGKAYVWLIRRPAYMLLTASDERLSREEPRRFAHSWVGLLALSLLWGIAMAGLWGAALQIFGNDPPRALSAVVTVGMTLLWLYRLSAARLVEAAAGPDSVMRTLFAAMLVVAMVFFYTAMREQYYREAYGLPEWLGWVRPPFKNCRLLLLMPLWGAWAMMILVQFVRPGPQTEPAVSAFAAGCGPLTATASLALPLTTSIFYFHFLPWQQLYASAAAIVVAIAGGYGLCRRCGGLTRGSLLAANLLTQLAFLLTYLALQ